MATTDTEQGINLVPQHSNFSIQFSGITRDGAVFNMTGGDATGWRFSLSPSLTGLALLTKQCNISGTAGPNHLDMDCDFNTRTVTVRVRASEITENYGQYYVALWAISASGDGFLGHDQKYLTIQPQISPS